LSNASNITKPSYYSARPRLRIAQIAPLYERIPPKLYGGTERVVSYIIEELVHRGHDVTLFAAGDAQTMAKLHPACPQALRLGQAGARSILAASYALGGVRERRRLRRHSFAY
jgi:hypothetical protein